MYEKELVYRMMTVHTYLNFPVVSKISGCGVESAISIFLDNSQGTKT